MASETLQLPVIDVRPLIARTADRYTVADQIGQACRDHGFFYIVGHGVEGRLQERLLCLSHQFFAKPLEKKMEIRMALAGRAWRGYFPVGCELTSGTADLKEGLYFGAELETDHPLVRAGTPLHGRNLFPSGIPLFRETVLEYLAAMTALGHRLILICCDLRCSGIPNVARRGTVRPTKSPSHPGAIRSYKTARIRIRGQGCICWDHKSRGNAGFGCVLEILSDTLGGQSNRRAP